MPYRTDGKSQFQTLVGHRAYVGQQFVVSEWRHGHIVGIEHVGSLGVVVFCGKHDAVVPESKVGTDIPGGTSLPFQVGIVVAQLAQGYSRRTAHRHDAVLPHGVECGVRGDAAEVARASISGTQLEHGDGTQLPEPRFLLHIPGQRHGREKSPCIVFAHHRRTVAAQRERQRVTVEQRIVGTPHDRSQGGVLTVTVCLAIKARGSSTEIIVAHTVGSQAGGRSPEARFGVFLILHTHHDLQRVYVPRIQEVGGHVAEPLLVLCLATVHAAVRPCPGGEELVVLVGRITVRTEGRDA